MKRILPLLLLVMAGCSSIEVITDKEERPENDRVQITEPDWHPARRGR